MIKPTNIINGELKIGTIIDLYPDRTYAYNDDNSDEVYPDFKLLYQYLGEERGFGVYTIDGLVDLAISGRDYHHDGNVKRCININGSLKCYYDDENDITFIFPNEAPSMFEYDNVTYYKNNLEFKDILVTEICPYAFCANAWENIPFTTETFEPFTYNRLEIPATIKHIREDAFKHTKIDGKDEEGKSHYRDVNFIDYSDYEASYSRWAQIEFASYYSAPFAGTDMQDPSTGKPILPELRYININGDAADSQSMEISNIDKISDYAFIATQMMDLITSNVKEIGKAAFAYAERLDTINVDENLEIIGDSAFENCIALTEVNGLTDNIKRIGNVAFRGTPILDSTKSPYYENDVYYVNGTYLNKKDQNCYFALDIRRRNISGGQKISLKNDTLLIADYCFHNQQYITTIYLPRSLKRIGRNAFLSASREYSSVEDYNECYNLSNLNAIYYYGGFDEWAQIEFANNASSPFNDNYSAMDDLKYINDNGAAYFTANQAQAKEGYRRTEWVHLYSLYNIPEDKPPERIVVFNPLASPLSDDGKSRYGWTENYAELTTINAHAFAYCMDIVSADLSAFPKLAHIGDRAFDNCRNMRHINLNNVLSIGYAALYDNLLVYTFSAPRLLHIGYFGLGFLGSQCSIHPGGHYLTELKLPSIQFIDKLGLAKIGTNHPSIDNSHTELYLGPNLEYLGTYAEAESTKNVLCSGFYELMATNQVYRWSESSNSYIEVDYTPYEIAQLVKPENWITGTITAAATTGDDGIISRNYYLGFIDNTNEFIPTILLYYGDNRQEIPDTVQIIGGRACFGNLVNYKRFRLPRALTQVGYEAFASPISVDYTRDGYGRDYTNPNDFQDYDIYQEYQKACSCKIENFYWVDEDRIEHEGLPNTLQYIDSRAFMGCKAPIELYNDNIKIIGTDPESFMESGIRKIKLPGEFSCSYEADGADNAIYSPSITISISEGTSDLSFGLFANCKNLEEISFPNTLKIIGSDYIAIPDRESTTPYTFQGSVITYSKLKELKIPESVTYITKTAFKANYDITTITVAEYNLHYYSADNCLIEYGNSFDYISQADPFLPKRTTDPHYYYALHKAYKGDKLLSGCSQSIIPLHITTICSGAFTEIDFINNAHLRDLDLSESNIIYIEEYAFLRCQGLLTLKLNQDTTHMLIGRQAFDMCINLMSVQLPNNQKTSSFNIQIDEYSGSVKPEHVNCVIGDNVFYNCIKLVEFLKPASLDCGTSESYNDNFKKYTEEYRKSHAQQAYDMAYYALDVRTGSEEESLLSVYVYENISNRKIKIYYRDFDLNRKLIINCIVLGSDPADIKVTIPDRIDSDEVSLNRLACASLDSRIKSITLPSTISAIPELCFAYNRSLKQLYFDQSITSIGIAAFYDCNPMLDIFFTDDNLSSNTLTSAKIPFYQTSWTHINFGEGVASKNEYNGINTCMYRITNQYLVSSNPLAGINCRRRLFVRKSAFDKEYQLLNFVDLFDLPDSMSNRCGPYYDCYCVKGCTMRFSSIDQDEIQDEIDFCAKFANTALIIVPIYDGVTYSIPSGISKDNFINVMRNLQCIITQQSQIISENNCLVSINSNTKSLLDAKMIRSTDLSGCEYAEIWPRAFSYNTSEVLEIKLGNNITHIYDYAFAWMDNLETINIPSSVTQLGQYAFANCLKLKDVIFDHYLPAEFEYRDITRSSIILPNNIFENCSSLEKIALWRIDINNTSSNAFKGCDQLRKIFFECIDYNNTHIGLSEQATPAAFKTLNLNLSKLEYIFTNAYTVHNLDISSKLSQWLEKEFADIKLIPASGISYNTISGDIKVKSPEIFFPIYINLSQISYHPDADTNIYIIKLDSADSYDIASIDTLYIGGANSDSSIYISDLKALKNLKNLYLPQLLGESTLQTAPEIFAECNFDANGKYLGVSEQVITLDNVYFNDSLSKWLTSIYAASPESSFTGTGISSEYKTNLYILDTANDINQLTELKESIKNNNTLSIDVDNLLPATSKRHAKICAYALVGYDLSNITLEFINNSKCNFTIGASAFANTNVEDLKFLGKYFTEPTQVQTYFGDKAFYNNNIKNLVLPINACFRTIFGDNQIDASFDVFSNNSDKLCTITEAHVPASTIPYLALTYENDSANTPATTITSLYFSANSLAKIYTEADIIKKEYNITLSNIFDYNIWKSLETVSVDTNELTYFIDDSGLETYSNLTNLFSNSSVMTLDLSNIQAPSDRVIVIPEGFCYMCKNLTTFKLPESVSINRISKQAFEDCSNLSSCGFILKSGLKYLDDSAFKNCTNLNSNMELTIPATCEYIGKSAFNNCSSFNQLIFEDDTHLREIRESAFKGCSNISSISIPDSVNLIERYAFKDCNISSYTAITLPEVMLDIAVDTFDEEITEDAGNYCIINKHLLKATNLSMSTSIDLSNYDILTIADNAFEENETITEVILPKSLKLIGKEAFNNVSNLTTVTVKNDQSDTLIDIQVIRENAFPTSIKQFTLDSNSYLLLGEAQSDLTTDVVLIADKAFMDAHIAPETLKLPKSLRYIGKEAFGEYVGYIDKWLIKASIDDLRILDNTVGIADNAFSSLIYDVNSITIPNNTARIGYNALARCFDLIEVNLMAYNILGSPWGAPVNTEINYLANYDPYYSQELEYSVDQDGITIIGIGDCTDSYISIPPTIERLPVISIQTLNGAQVKGIKINHSDITIDANIFNVQNVPNLQYINFATSDIPTFTSDLADLPNDIFIEVPGGAVSAYKENSELQEYKDNIYAQHFTLALEKDLDFKFTNICNALRRGFTAIGAEGTTDQGDSVQVLRTYTVAEIAQELNNLIDAFNEKLEIKEI